MIVNGHERGTNDSTAPALDCHEGNFTTLGCCWAMSMIKSDQGLPALRGHVPSRHSRSSDVSLLHGQTMILDAQPRAGRKKKEADQAYWLLLRTRSKASLGRVI